MARRIHYRGSITETGEYSKSYETQLCEVFHKLLTKHSIKVELIGQVIVIDASFTKIYQQGFSLADLGIKLGLTNNVRIVRVETLYDAVTALDRASNDFDYSLSVILGTDKFFDLDDVRINQLVYQPASPEFLGFSELQANELVLDAMKLIQLKRLYDIRNLDDENKSNINILRLNKATKLVLTDFADANLRIVQEQAIAVLFETRFDSNTGIKINRQMFVGYHSSLLPLPTVLENLRTLFPEYSEKLRHQQIVAIGAKTAVGGMLLSLAFDLWKPNTGEIDPRLDFELSQGVWSPSVSELLFLVRLIEKLQTRAFQHGCLILTHDLHRTIMILEVTYEN